MTTSCSGEGIDAPICQDGRSGGFTELLARAEVSHDALIDFPSEKAFKASDDVPFRPSIRPASDDIVDRRLVIAHTDHDGSMEGGVRLSVAAPDRGGVDRWSSQRRRGRDTRRRAWQRRLPSESAQGYPRR